MPRQLIARTRTVIATAVAIASVACTTSEKRHRRSADGALSVDRPNVVLVLLDDLDVEAMAYMPRSLRLVGDSGVTLTNAFVSSPLCCPSRVSLLRGQYPHNTGVVANRGEHGGFEAAYRKGVDSSTIATWLTAAGYRTALFGKYLNFYPIGASPTYVPPGWSEWAVPMRGTPYSEFNYSLNINGRIREFGDDASDYGTDVYVGLAERFIRASVSDERPFFLLLSPFAPHTPATPAPRHEKLFADVSIPETPSRREEDISDKPPLMRDLPWLAPRQHRKMEEEYRNRLRSLQAVDEGVERLIKVLREVDVLKSTVFVVTSDNGYHLLDHRLPSGKETAYDTDIRVPFVARGPRIPHGVRRSEIVLNNDLAPTIAELAGAPVPSFVDGRSAASVLHGEARGPWREGFLVMRRLPDHLKTDLSALTGDAMASSASPVGVGEHEEVSVMPPLGDSARARGKPMLYPPAARAALAMIQHYPHFDALRTHDGWSYIRHEGGFVELYDLNRDPYQLDNLAVTRLTPEVREQLKHLGEWTNALLKCRGASCREIEDAHIP